MHPRTKPSSRCRRAGRRARLPSCGFPGRRPGPRSSSLAGQAAGAADGDAGRCCADRDSEPIDDAVVLWFPGPASATGEDVAEFHVHGGRAVLATLFAALSALKMSEPRSRANSPGAPSRTASSISPKPKALDDLIHADTDRQRRQALRQLKGLLGDSARDWRAQIIEASALIEAGIDFSDEGDVPAELIAPALARIKALLGEIEEVLAAQGKSERLREGLVVAIAGPPNVGKSTLMNQLARREVAIVSPHAGTTRDVIEVQLDLDGYPVTVIDTAGDSRDRRSRRAGRCAAGAGARGGSGSRVVADRCGARRGRAARRRGAGMDGAQQDRSRCRGGCHSCGNRLAGESVEFEISAGRGDGVPELIPALVGFAQDYFGSGEGGLIGRERQRELLREAAVSCDAALT